MSSLTDEQKKKIEENRKKALEKLLRKSSKPFETQQGCTLASPSRAEKSSYNIIEENRKKALEKLQNKSPKASKPPSIPPFETQQGCTLASPTSSVKSFYNRIEENRKKALEKLQNKSPKSSKYKSSNIPPFETQQSCTLGSPSSRSEKPSYNKTFTGALKKAEFNVNKTCSGKSDTSNNSNPSEYPKNYYSPPKDNPKGQSNHSREITTKINLFLAMKNSIWFKVDHSSMYTNTIKTVAQKIDIRQFDKTLSRWCFHIEDYKNVVNTFEKELNVSIDGIPENVVNILQNAHRNRNKEEELDLSKIGPELLEKLMEFQKEGIRFGIQRKGRVLLADDMGLGKTVQAICLCAYYKEEWPLLIICPSSVKMSWQQHFVEWIEDVDVSDVNIVNNGKEDPCAGRINIISYDLASKHVGKIYRQQFSIIVADECHFLKNQTAGRTKNIVPLLQGTRRAILLSGTPALSRPKELFTQIKALDKTLFPGYHKFSLRYCNARQTLYGWEDTGSSNDSELQAVLTSTLMIRRMKHEVLRELPDKQRQIVTLDPSMIKNPKQLVSEEKMFLEAKSDKRAALLNYFQKTCEAKLKGVREYVSEKLESGCKIIVFAHHMLMLDEIEGVAILKKVDYVRLDGSTNQKLRQNMIDNFNNDEKCLMAVLSLTACGTGLNITGSSNVIFAELYWNPGHLKQAEDRAYRIGQKNSVLITYLVAKKTADDYIWPMVQNKLRVLTNLGIGMKKGFAGKCTKQEDSRQKSMLDFFETLIEEDDKDFVAQIDQMNTEPKIEPTEPKSEPNEPKSEPKTGTNKPNKTKTENKISINNNENNVKEISEQIIPSDLFSDDLLLSDAFNSDDITDDLLTDDLFADVLEEPASKRTKTS